MIKTLAKNIKGFIKESVLTPFFMILEVIVETIIPFLMSSMIDDGINKGYYRIVAEFLINIIIYADVNLLCHFAFLHLGQEQYLIFPHYNTPLV